MSHSSQELVQIAEERQVDIPALVYEARPVSSVPALSHCFAFSGFRCASQLLHRVGHLAHPKGSNLIVQVRRDSAEHLHEVASDSAWAHAMRPRRMHDITTNGAATHRAGVYAAPAAQWGCAGMYYIRHLL